METKNDAEDRGKQSVSDCKRKEKNTQLGLQWG